MGRTERRERIAAFQRGRAARAAEGTLGFQSANTTNAADGQAGTRRCEWEHRAHAPPARVNRCTAKQGWSGYTGATAECPSCESAHIHPTATTAGWSRSPLAGVDRSTAGWSRSGSTGTPSGCRFHGPVCIHSTTAGRSYSPIAGSDRTVARAGRQPARNDVTARCGRALHVIHAVLHRDLRERDARRGGLAGGQHAAEVQRGMAVLQVQSVHRGGEFGAVALVAEERRL